MSDIIFMYDKEGEDLFGIWSTVVEDVVVYDLTAQEIIQFKGKQAAREARQETSTIVQQLQWGRNPYNGWYADKPEPETIRKLERGDFE